MRRGGGIDWPPSRDPAATQPPRGPRAGPARAPVRALAGYGLADFDGDGEGDGAAAGLPCAAFFALSSAVFIRARSWP